MIKIFEKIENKEKPQFSMPLSLRLIKECSQNGIDWKLLHYVDLLSLIYSFRIDNAKKYLEHQRQQKMQKRGIQSVATATEQDFDNL